MGAQCTNLEENGYRSRFVGDAGLTCAATFCHWVRPQMISLESECEVRATRIDAFVESVSSRRQVLVGEKRCLVLVRFNPNMLYVVNETHT